MYSPGGRGQGGSARGFRRAAEPASRFRGPWSRTPVEGARLSCPQPPRAWLVRKRNCGASRLRADYHERERPSTAGFSLHLVKHECCVALLLCTSGVPSVRGLQLRAGLVTVPARTVPRERPRASTTAALFALGPPRSASLTGALACAHENPGESAPFRSVEWALFLGWERRLSAGLLQGGPGFSPCPASVSNAMQVGVQNALSSAVVYPAARIDGVEDGKSSCDFGNIVAILEASEFRTYTCCAAFTQFFLCVTFCIR